MNDQFLLYVKMCARSMYVKCSTILSPLSLLVVFHPFSHHLAAPSPSIDTKHSNTQTSRTPDASTSASASALFQCTHQHLTIDWSSKRQVCNIMAIVLNSTRWRIQDAGLRGIQEATHSLEDKDLKRTLTNSSELGATESLGCRVVEEEVPPRLWPCCRLRPRLCLLKELFS